MVRYRYKALQVDTYRTMELSSLRPALVMARHDMEFQAALYRAVRIEDGRRTYTRADIRRLTNIDDTGWISVSHPEDVA